MNDTTPFNLPRVRSMRSLHAARERFCLHGALTLVCAVAVSSVACEKKPKQSPPTVEEAHPAPTASAVPQKYEGQTADFGYYAVNSRTSSIAWEGRKVTGVEKGSFGSFEGHIEVLEPVHPNRIELSIDTTSLTTANEKLTAHLKSPDFFDVAQFPAAHFTLIAAQQKQGVPSAYDVSGTLQLHGVTKAITFPVTVTFEAGHLKAKADPVINRKDFGLVYPGKRDDLIADNVTVHINIDATKR